MFHPDLPLVIFVTSWNFKHTYSDTLNGTSQVVTLLGQFFRREEFGRSFALYIWKQFVNVVLGGPASLNGNQHYPTWEKLSQTLTDQFPGKQETLWVAYFPGLILRIFLRLRLLTCIRRWASRGGFIIGYDYFRIFNLLKNLEF